MKNFHSCITYNGQHFRKQQKIKAKDSSKSNLKTTSEIISSPRDKILQHSKRKMKVANQKHDKNKPIILSSIVFQVLN